MLSLKAPPVVDFIPSQLHASRAQGTGGIASCPHVHWISRLPASIYPWLFCHHNTTRSYSLPSTCICPYSLIHFIPRSILCSQAYLPMRYTNKNGPSHTSKHTHRYSRPNKQIVWSPPPPSTRYVRKKKKNGELQQHKPGI